MKSTMKFLLELCAGPLLAVAVCAVTSDSYDTDEQTASLLSCEWNTYMCCWTGNDRPGGMTANSDVCRVQDYPESGDVLELPRDDEGPVYCHGFAWRDDAGFSTYILPLYDYVTNVVPTEAGLYGSVEEAPECGCIEAMPVVDDAACSEYSRDGIGPCVAEGLQTHYRGWADQPNGPMEFNLVGECDNTDVPDDDFRSCEHNTYLCCWTENDGLGMTDNTDVCRAGETEYPGESEGYVHCHGFVWPEDATDSYIHLLAQYVQTFAHIDTRGYYGNIPGAPMCGCVEEMAEITESDCTTNHDTLEGRFQPCTSNDLRTRFTELYPDGVIANLVGECDNA